VAVSKLNAFTLEFESAARQDRHQGVQQLLGCVEGAAVDPGSQGKLPLLEAA
jgi:hypothetical protein